MSDEPRQPTALTWAVAAEDLETRAKELSPIAALGERYEDRGLIAVGGMGEVRRVHDRRLDCIVAMKVLANRLVDDAAARSRFVTEGTITAQLRHPGIVAVHDRGELEDGRLWYTMTEVAGDTLERFGEGEPDLAPAVQLRRWVDVLRRVCDAMAYAHAQGVVHRDLKPDNLMVGRFGEVLVMDWGIAMRQSDPPEPAGVVIGTPRFMAPEQVRGATDQIGPWSDVYALGVMLHERLLGVPLVPGNGSEVLERRRTKPITPFEQGEPPDLPEALVTLIRAALAENPGDRPETAEGFGEALESWSSGAEQRARAEATLAEAMASYPQIADQWAQVDAHRRSARTLLEALTPYARAEDKEPAWAEEKQAEVAAREAAMLEAGWLRGIGAALEQAPDLEAAHDALADHYAARLLQAEAARRAEEVVRFEIQLAQHDRSGRHAALLSGIGAVTVVTEPPGATVRAFRFEERKGRLVPMFHAELGQTPLVEAALDRGSWLLELDHPDRPLVRYPVALGRGEAWTGVRPGDTEPFAVELPLAEAYGPDDVYVPAGWFWSGGDDEAIEPLARRRLWANALFVRRHPITVAEFLALRDHEPTLAAANPAGEGWDDEGSWVGPSEGHQWPMTGLTHFECEALARAEAARTQRDWRLPSELEFEKYARGVDGRYFVWGDRHEYSWANVMGHDPELAYLRSVDDNPVDVSVYGVLGCVGNARDRCGNAWLLDGPPVGPFGLVLPYEPPPEDALVSSRGGEFRAVPSFTRLASRLADPQRRRFQGVGVRLVRPHPSSAATRSSRSA